MAWDHRNRLVSVTDRVSLNGAIVKSIQYVYDAFDNKVGKLLDADGNGTIDSETAWVYSEGHALLQFRDTDGVGSAQNLRLSNRYLYADIVDMLLADEQFLTNNGPLLSATSASGNAGTTLWPLTDHLGSVRDVVDNSKVVRQHVNYDAFGNRISEVYRNTSGTVVGAGTPGSIQILFGFTGRDWDTDSELQYNRARWFDPKTGRWLSQDPISFAAGDANLYRYVGNDATNATDPSGWLEYPWYERWSGWNPITWIPRVGASAGRTATDWTVGWYYSGEGMSIEVGSAYERKKSFDPLNDDYCDYANMHKMGPATTEFTTGLARGSVEWTASGGMFLKTGAGGLGNDILRGGNKGPNKRLVVGGGRTSGFPALRDGDIALNISSASKADIIGDIRLIDHSKVGTFKEVFFERVPFDVIDDFTACNVAKMLEPGGNLKIWTGRAANRNGIRETLEKAGFIDIQISENLDRVLEITARLGGNK